MRPPHVRLPTIGPRPFTRKKYGSASPPEDEYAFTSIAFGPSCAKAGVRRLSRPRRAQNASVRLEKYSIMRSGMNPPPL